jgi:hypothetical protein
MPDKWPLQKLMQAMADMSEEVIPGSIWSNSGLPQEKYLDYTPDQMILFIHRTDQIFAEAGWTRDEFFGLQKRGKS